MLVGRMSEDVIDLDVEVCWEDTGLLAVHMTLTTEDAALWEDPKSMELRYMRWGRSRARERQGLRLSLTASCCCTDRACPR